MQNDFYIKEVCLQSKHILGSILPHWTRSHTHTTVSLHWATKKRKEKQKQKNPKTFMLAKILKCKKYGTIPIAK